MRRRRPSLLGVRLGLWRPAVGRRRQRRRQGRALKPSRQQAGVALKELPNKADSLEVRRHRRQRNRRDAAVRVGKQMMTWHEKFPFVLVVMMGDNIYGSDRPQDFVKKFETPYKPLLDAGVKFYASLGNHDSPNSGFYKFFNMDGKRYYSFKAPKQDVRFFALESTYMDKDQLAWLEKELDGLA